LWPAAVRLHQEALLRHQSGFIEAGIEVADLAHRHWLEIGVQQRRRQPRPLADARQHFAGQRYVDARELLENEPAS
jgi:hypothetical protein